jgi:hypothetical protein
MYSSRMASYIRSCMGKPYPPRGGKKIGFIVNLVLAAGLTTTSTARPTLCQELQQYRVESQSAKGASVFGIHLTGSTRIAGYYGVMVSGRQDRLWHYESPWGDTYKGTLVLAEVGIGGAELSWGIGVHSTGEWPLSLRMQVSLLRTWWKTRHASPGQWFLGPEFQFMALGPGLRLGYFWRIGGHRKLENSFFSFGWILGL